MISQGLLRSRGYVRVNGLKLLTASRSAGRISNLIPIERKIETSTSDTCVTEIPAYNASPDIILYPNPILCTVCQPVTEFDENLKLIIEKMFKVIQDMYGAGLSAPQVGSSLRLICISPYIDRSLNITMINPIITSKSPETGYYFPEKCLSFHGKPELENLSILRHKSIEVTYTSWIPTSITPQVKKKSYSGWMSCIIQHEIDHLNGVLYIDHLNK